MQRHDSDNRGLLEFAANPVAVSVGSACYKDDQTMGGVLGAMGIAAARARGVVQLMFESLMTGDDIEVVTQRLIGTGRILIE